MGRVVVCTAQRRTQLLVCVRTTWVKRSLSETLDMRTVSGRTFSLCVGSAERHRIVPCCFPPFVTLHLVFVTVSLDCQSGVSDVAPLVAFSPRPKEVTERQRDWQRAGERERERERAFFQASERELERVRESVSV